MSAFTYTDEQRQIIRYRDGHQVVQAAAGAGKTATAIAKILYESGDLAVDGKKVEVALPLSSIAAISFTRKAAGDLRQRLLNSMFGAAGEMHGKQREVAADMALSANRARIGTIDAFARSLISEFGAVVGFTHGFDILGDGEAYGHMVAAAEHTLEAGIGMGDPVADFLERHFGWGATVEFMVDALSQADLLAELRERARSGSLSWGQYGAAASQSGEIVLPGQDGGFRFTQTAADKMLERMANPSAIIEFLGKADDHLLTRFKAEGVLDHGHVLLTAAEMAKSPAFRQEVAAHVSLILVDEYQDTSPAQAKLLFRLAGLPAPGDVSSSEPATTAKTLGPRLVLIGDTQQGIYRFRHADIRLWDASAEVLTRAGGITQTLTVNHRTVPSILTFVDSFMGKVMGDDTACSKSPYEVAYRSMTSSRQDHGSDPTVSLLVSHVGNGVPPNATPQALAEAIRKALDNPTQTLVEAKDAEGNKVWRPMRAPDVCLVFRKLDAVAAAYEQALRAQGIGSNVVGGRGLYDRPEIQDLVLLLRVIVNPEDEFAMAAFLRSPLGGVDDETLARLAAAVKAGTARSVYAALHSAPVLFSNETEQDERARARATDAAALIDVLRDLRDRVPHARLIEEAIDRSGYLAFLSGAPNSPAPTRNVQKFVGIARSTSKGESFAAFVETLQGRVRRAEAEREAPLYSPTDEIVTMTTIHSAKALEWPIVIFVDIDKPMIRPPSDHRPYLSAELGVALPLEITVRGKAGEPDRTVRPVSWDAFCASETWQEYAEAKRLTYVALTRAQDHLMLAGRLTSANQPDAPHAPSWRFWGMEHWLRWAFPEMLPKSKDEDMPRQFAYGAASGTGLVRIEKWGGPAPIDPARALPAYPAIAPDLMVGLEVMGDVSPPERPVDVEARQGSVWSSAPIRRTVSPTELMEMDLCWWRHSFGFRHMVREVKVRTRTAGERNHLDPEIKGDILHRYLERHQDTWTEQERMEALGAAVRQYVQASADQVAAHANEIYPQVANYLASEWHQRMSRAKRVYREFPFRLRLNDGTDVDGVIDLVFEDDDGWWILDFKTGFVEEEASDETVADRALHYEIQSMVYERAIREGLGLERVAAFVFFFTAAGRYHRIDPTPDWQQAGVARVDRAVASIRCADQPDHPQYAQHKCPDCRYRAICRPAGDPNLVQISAPARPDAAAEVPSARCA